MSPTRLLTGLLFIALITGCQGDQDSRRLASQLRQLAAEHQSLSTAKLEAERKFYLDSLANLQHSLNVVDPAAAPSEQPDVKKSLAYVRIITEANGDSLEMAETLVKGSAPPVTAGTITRFLRDGVKAEQAAFLEARQSHADAEKALVVDFSKLDEYQTKLSVLVKELVELEKPASESDRLNQLRAIGEAVREQLDSDDKAE